MTYEGISNVSTRSYAQVVSILARKYMTTVEEDYNEKHTRLLHYGITHCDKMLQLKGKLLQKNYDIAAALHELSYVSIRCYTQVVSTLACKYKTSV